MTPFQIVFLIIALATLISAVMVVTARRIMHAALWLIMALMGVAALFATLESGFFTAVQVVVYVGAIAILIIFAVMLTRRDQQDSRHQNNRYTWLAALIALGVGGGLISALAGWQSFAAGRTALNTSAAAEGALIIDLGKALVSPDAYAVPFEVASVLLIGALIGAIFVANEQRK
ncbi:MAG: NADH-quinone oxidoreductase subunit J [Chloroflexi bacterium]|nr:MAG: NADH-quinone oxidoreductase subunit J [Chloroflexota bacterium]